MQFLQKRVVSESLAEQSVPEIVLLILSALLYWSEFPPAGSDGLELDSTRHSNTAVHDIDVPHIVRVSTLIDWTAGAARFVAGTEQLPLEPSDCLDRRRGLRSNDTRLHPVSHILPTARRAYLV